MDAQSLLDGSPLARLNDGRLDLQKPPLYYWLVAAVGWLRGSVDAWAVRLPAAGSALLCVLALLLLLAYGRGRSLAGLLAGCVLATAMHFTWLARIGRIDMPLTLAVTIASGCFYLARRRRQEGNARAARALLLVAYLALAAGVLLKGPIGIILPAAIVLAHRLIEGELHLPWRTGRCGSGLWRLALDAGLPWGLALVAALTLPWFLSANAATHGELARVFLWHHNVERALGGSTLRSNPWWFYGPQLAVDFLPWTPFLVVAAVWSWRHGYWRADAEARFGLVWLLAVTLVLSCARFKRADYLLPAYPGAALFLGCIFERRLLLARPASQRALAAVLLPALAVAVAVVGWAVRLEWLLPAQEPYRDYTHFAAEVRRHAPCPQEVVFFRTEAHALAFHLGHPLTVLVQWPELGAYLDRPGTHYVIVPASSREECRQRLSDLYVEEILCNTDLSNGRHERPLALLRCTNITPDS